MRRGLPLQVTAEYGQWRRVRDADGAGGWVHQTLLSGARTAVVLDREAPVPLRAGRGRSSAMRALRGTGRGRRGSRPASGAWCEIAAGGLDGWLPRGAIWGVGADERLD